MQELPLPKHIWWPWNQPAERVGFERAFKLALAAPARLYVACSGSYRAWLDGTELQTPTSHLPSWRAMHQYGLELQPGPHRLRIEAESIRAAGGSPVFANGQITGGGPLALPFLMACLDWDENGQAQRLATDAEWQMILNPLPGSGAEGWNETDSSLQPADSSLQPADRSFRPAWAFDGVWSEPWGMPCNAPEDFCRLTSGWQRLGKRALERVAGLAPGAASLGASIQAGADGSLEIRPPLPYPVSLPNLNQTLPRAEWYRTREAHSLINNTWLDLFENRCAYAILDAGGETFARLRLSLRGGGPAILAVTTGESLNEVKRYARRVTDLFELQDGESFTTAPTGFRYVKVMGLSAGGERLQLEPLELQEITYPVDFQGRFRCSDGDLNDIFDLSVRTLHLCMQDSIWDGIKRDQLPWMGDLYTEALASYLLFGETRLAGRTLSVLADLGPGPGRALEKQRSPGLYAIWRTVGGDINDIPCYTLWYLIGLWDYWQYSGDLALIREFSSEIRAALEHIAAWVDPQGRWRVQSGWDFVDWAPLSAEERGIYAHLLACRALRLGMELLEALGLEVQAFTPIQTRMAQAARQAWWQAGQAGFGPSHHTNAQAICSGILDPAEAARLFAETLQHDPPLSMTYWHRYLDLTAAQRVDAIPWGLDYIRRHWGQALQVGMTTLWEAFDPAWIGDDPHAISMVGAGYARYGGYETSLCHGWSCGPAIWLLNAVLGITPARPGFAAVRFQPRLGDLSWAEGDIPTPLGSLHVRLRQAGPAEEKPHAWLEAPAGMEIQIEESERLAWEIEIQRRPL